MRSFATLLRLIVLTIVAAGSGLAAVINVNCDYLSISNAVCHTAQEGDTVLIGPGDCVIPNEIDINRNISFTIAGSGTNQTTLRGSPTTRQVIWIISDSTNVFTVRDLNLVCHPAESIWLSIGSSSFEFPGPYHIYNIQMTNVMGRGISMGYGKSHNAYGSLDHSVFIAAPAGFLQCVDFEGADYAAWSNPNPLGTANVSCVEDCYFEVPPGVSGNGFFDSYVGAQVLFRHNFCNGYAPIGGHGYDSQPTSIRTWEIYDNVFTNQGVGSVFAVWRGGSGVMFSNVAYGTSVSTFGALAYYRAYPVEFPLTLSPPTYLGWGVPGRPYIINFSGWVSAPGEGTTLSGQPANGQLLLLGETHYYFVSSLNNATFNMADSSGYGGGAVLIGSTLAETITNLYRAINVVPGYYGVSYTNWAGMAFNPGHDFIATGLDRTNLYLRNALDANNQYGYPANQQPGVVQSYRLTGVNFVNNQTRWPAYAWSNTFNGSIRGLEHNPPVGDTTGNTNLIIQGRDYFNNVIPSPSTYTPLVYPYPLQASGNGGNTNSLPVAPPSSLKAAPGP